MYAAANAVLVTALYVLEAHREVKASHLAEPLLPSSFVSEQERAARSACRGAGDLPRWANTRRDGRRE
eukprot:3617117-Prymnesium_polylepis.1